MTLDESNGCTVILDEPKGHIFDPCIANAFLLPPNLGCRGIFFWYAGPSLSVGTHTLFGANLLQSERVEVPHPMRPYEGGPKGQGPNCGFFWG